MPAPGIVTVGSLVLQAQFKANLENSNFVKFPEWMSYANVAVKELYDLLIGAYGNDYPTGNPPIFIPMDGQNFLFNLPDGTNYTVGGITPPAFYKLLGLDLALSTSLDSYVTIKPFMFGDRNRYSIPNFQSFYGVTNLRYRLFGNQLWLTPIPAGNQQLRLWYLPRPADLFLALYGGFSGSSLTVNMNDTTGLKVGYYVQDPAGLIQAGTTITAIAPNSSITLSQITLGPSSNSIIMGWQVTTPVDGLAGWEEYAIVDMAIRALQKEESDVQVLMAQKEALRQRIMAMADTRDVGSPPVVGDNQSNSFWWPNGNSSGSGVGSG